MAKRNQRSFQMGNLRSRGWTGSDAGFHLWSELEIERLDQEVLGDLVVQFGPTTEVAPNPLPLSIYELGEQEYEETWGSESPFLAEHLASLRRVGLTYKEVHKGQKDKSAP